MVLGKITTAIYDFRENAKNPLGLPAAASQADVAAHSMGGLLARWASRPGRGDGTYLANPAHPGGTIHKLITIGTPHFGSNWATQVLADFCFQGYYASPSWAVRLHSARPSRPPPAARPLGRSGIFKVMRTGTGEPPTTGSDLRATVAASATTCRSFK